MNFTCTPMKWLANSFHDNTSMYVRTMKLNLLLIHSDINNFISSAVMELVYVLIQWIP
jgi:hypothetical protein